MVSYVVTEFPTQIFSVPSSCNKINMETATALLPFEYIHDRILFVFYSICILLLRHPPFFR